MKKQNSKRILIAIIGFCLISTVFAMFNLNVKNDYAIANDGEDGQSLDNINTKPKTSATYYYNLTIDNAGANDWEWATTQPWCSGSGTFGDPYLIEGDTILINNTYTAAINISNSHNVYFRISDVTVRNNASDTGIGISLDNCNNGIIVNVNASDNGDIGISVTNSMNITIDDSMMRNNHHHGLFMDNTTVSIITNSTMSYSSLGNARLNNCTYNLFQGSCYFTHSSYGGIMIIDSDLNNITGCFFSDSTSFGVGWQDSDNITFTENRIEDETIGIIITTNDGDSNYSLIYNNYLVNCVWNALDNSSISSNNQWDNGVLGNYWDDYAGADLDDDGIGDTPEPIYHGISGGGITTYDNFPIWDDGDDVAPVITIADPNANQIYISAPFFIITIVEEEGIYNRWYTINAGGTNTTFTGLNGTISTSLWANVYVVPGQEVSIVLTFYVNDTSGNIGSASVTIRKACPKETADRELYEPRYVVEQAYVTVILVALFILFKVKGYYSKLIRIR